MNVPVFIDISLEEQAEELRSYFKRLGAEISEERSPKGLEDDLHKIIGVCDSCFKDASEAEVEGVMNGMRNIRHIWLCSSITRHNPFFRYRKYVSLGDWGQNREPHPGFL